uniref:Uncharacterized protein n=1 Tax=viral metagenome TaxID=1070528 RepID=A0A6C0AZ78_9ZZZZ
MKFGVFTRKERAFLNADVQERGSLLHEPGDEPSTTETQTSKTIKKIIQSALNKLYKIDDPIYIWSVITTASNGRAVLIIKEDTGYLIGMYDETTKEEKIVPIKFENIDSTYIELVKLLDDVKYINLVGGDNDRNVRTILKLYEEKGTPSKVYFGKQNQLAKLNSDIKYLS